MSHVNTCWRNFLFGSHLDDTPIPQFSHCLCDHISLFSWCADLQFHIPIFQDICLFPNQLLQEQSQLVSPVDGTACFNFVKTLSKPEGERALKKLTSSGARDFLDFLILKMRLRGEGFPQSDTIRNTMRNTTLATNISLQGVYTSSLSLDCLQLQSPEKQVNCNTGQLSSFLSSFWIIIKGYENILDITVITQGVMVYRCSNVVGK